MGLRWNKNERPKYTMHVYLHWCYLDFNLASVFFFIPKNFVMIYNTNNSFQLCYPHKKRRGCKPSVLNVCSRVCSSVCWCCRFTSARANGYLGSSHPNQPNLSGVMERLLCYFYLTLLGAMVCVRVSTTRKGTPLFI